MIDYLDKARWGSEFYESLSKDLVFTMPEQKSFSPRNLRYMAQYAVESAGEPIGIFEYELSRVYPADFKSYLPTIAESEQQLRN